jgi:NTP pyrophosphatase (non-canonical NTP hydrolase)
MLKKKFMKLSDYKDIIQKTAVYPKEVTNFDNAYIILGLIDEWGEFIEHLASASDNSSNNEEWVHSLIKEHGDWVWYTTAFCNVNNINLESIFIESSIKDIITVSNIPVTAQLLRLAGSVKKFYRDGKPIDNEKIIKVFINMNHIGNLVAEKFGYTFPQVLETNYNKLIKRRETNTIHGDGDNREQSISSN